MNYEERSPWPDYTYEVPGGRYEVYESFADPVYVDLESTALQSIPVLNLRADEGTLNCLKWILIDQKDVDLEIKTAPYLENFEYASSDEDIWDALSDGKERKKLKAKNRPLEINTTCEWQRCNAQFSNNADYRSHIARHFQEFVGTDYEEYLCEWDLCGFKTNCLDMFERHVLHHEMHGRFLAEGESQELMNKLPKCTLAGLERNRLPELLTDFTCLWKECGDSFRSLSLLHDHLMEHIEDTFVRGTKGVCQWRGCSFTATQLALLKLHASRMHAQVLVYACRKCGQSRKSKRTFLAHFLSQAPVKNPELCCPHCNQLFLKDTHLRGHVKNRHQAVICNICHLNFMGETQLKIHVANIHVKLRPFKCPDCPKAFPTKNNLRAHMHVHNEKEGGYQCSNCDYLGSSYLALRKHNYASHMGRNYPYECHLCGVQYDNARKLSTHFKKVHDLGVPEGFHRYTYRLEEGPVFHLKTYKTYEPNEKGLDKPLVSKIKMPRINVPVKMEVKVEVEESSGAVKVELHTDSVLHSNDDVVVKTEQHKSLECTGAEGGDPGKHILTRSRAAKKHQT